MSPTPALPTGDPMPNDLPLAADTVVCAGEAADLAAAGPTLSLLAAAELQDHLLEAGNDLDRLQRLLDDAGDNLLASFYGASTEIKALLHSQGLSGPEADRAHAAMTHLAQAITAMQFQDMATQLVAHTTRRLRGCADRLAAVAFDDDDDPGVLEDPAPRPNPVTQDEMDAGSVELF
jgi:hypothetical protein